MKVSKLRLVNFRSAMDLNIDFEPGMNLLVGVNGAGKSTILDSLAILLSWAAARLRSPNAPGRRILEKDIHNKGAFSTANIACKTHFPEPAVLSWDLRKTRKGRNLKRRSLNPDSEDKLREYLGRIGLNKWANKAREQIGHTNEQVNLPLFVYYPVNRSVLDIPLRIRKSHDFDLLDAYNDALTMGANFRSFFEWFRNREDLENESFRYSRKFKEDPQLNAVRRAIKIFLPDFSEISVKRNPLRMEVSKGGEPYRVDQLSDGEKCLFAMVGDLARRLAIANPAKKDALEGDGIVLIDEIDLHLHPAWQRMVVSKLPQAFPNCQFIVSTHSPQVLGEVEAKCVRRLSVDPKIGLSSTTPRQAFGLDSSLILEELMEAKSRSPQTAGELGKIFRLIDQEKFAEAKKQIRSLSKKVGGDIPEIVHAKSLITMLAPDAGK
ncbi:MAG: AAA family ATPase [Desulfatibacillaceae bacterium]|nr:AAA family ATPase [Desulfatibacillaceae bacterium]